MKITSPLNTARRSIDTPIILRAEVNCAGVVGETQFWVKPNGAHTWTKLPGYSTTETAWTPSKEGAWNVTAVAHAVGSSSSRDVRAPTITILVSQRGAPNAKSDSITTRMSTAMAFDLVANDEDPDGDALVVTGFTQPAHGKVTLSGSTATYTPLPGFVGKDCFRYTVSDGNGHSSTASVEVAITAVAPVCTITIAGPPTGIIGTPVHLTATASCNVGAAEIQWLHHIPNFAFSVFKNFSLDTFADFNTNRAPTGLHSFEARVRAQGTEQLFTSNVVTTTLSREASPCTAVALDTPANGARFASNQAIALHATASCPAGVSPEYQFWARVPGAASWTILAAYGDNASSFTPSHGGNWELSAVARAIGSTAAFQAQSPSAVVSVNDAPLANDDELVIDEDQSGSVNVLANDSDPNGDALTATITGEPDVGAATISDGVVTYTPAPDFHGSDSLSYTVDDGHGHTATATLRITINAVNDAPAAIHDSLVAIEDTAASLDVTLNDLDVDGDTLTVIDVHPPDHGTASFSGTVVTYAPAANYNGPDSFQYTITDGHGGNSAATVFVDVQPVNDTPVAADDDLATPEDADGGVYLVGNDIDPDGETPNVISFNQPEHGSVSVVAGFASYHPVHDYNGPDSFTYTIADAAGATSTATVHITVLPVNDPPVAVDDTAALDEDTRATFDVVADDSDVDGDELTVASVTQPAHGTATIVSGHEVEYTPAPDFRGSDAFTYTLSDPSGAQATATVTLTVVNVNDAPSAANDTASVDEDGSVSIDVVANDTDADGDAITVISVTVPEHGTATVVDATHVQYTPAANFHGSDAFAYTVADGNGGTGTAQVELTVNSVNDAPVAADDAATTDEDSAATIDVVANDSDLDGDTLSVTEVTQPAHGIAEVIDARHVVYTPAPDYSGADAFTYTVGDGNGGAATATVAVTVNPGNDAPIARADGASLLEDTFATIDVVANDSDIDGDALAIAAVTQPAAGAVVILDGHRVVYTPAPNFHGGDAFTYTIADPSGAQSTAAVVIDVISVNDAPIAHGDAATLDEDTAVTVDVVGNDFDVDGDDLAVTALDQPAHGIATVVDGHRVRYIPAPDFHGLDALAYTISDGHGGISIAELALTVDSVNDAPVAVDDPASLDEDTDVTVDVVANDSDVDGDAIAIASIAQPAHGSATIVGARSVHYVPAANYHGPDGVAYTVSDGQGGQATATLILDVISVNDAPVAANDAAGLDEDTSATVDVVGNDSDVDGDTLVIASIAQPAHGAVTIADGHRVSYTPAADYHGPDSLSYTISDGHGATATATLALDVASVNDAPVVVAGSASTFDDTPVPVALFASDVDGDALSLAIAGGPAHGTLTPVAGNRVTYTPAAGFVGADAFTFTASDGQAVSAAATVSITVIKSVCGNGAREGVHEECDDGNATPSDGCETSCRLTCGSGTGADRSTVDATSGHCFAAYDGLHSSYQDTTALCGGFGGHLPTIATLSEDDAAAAAIRTGDNPWLGGDDIAVEGTLRWTTGEAFAYSNFAAGKPDNAGNADCLHYLPDGTWSDTECSGADGVSGALCEFELAVATPAFATGGAGTRGVAIADFNGDGYPDVAATNQTANTVGVLFGNGAGGFALAATYPTGNGPTAVAAGDFTGDGNPDLAVVNGATSTLSVLRGSASGALTAGATIAIASGATSITAADFDQDGKLDLAVAASGTVQVLHGDGAGGFTASASILITGLGASIAAGDFNGDGRIDLAVTTPLAVLVALSTGSGFGLPTSIALSLNNRSVVARDLDGDGRLDLVVANGATNVSVFFGNPLGLFLAPITLTLPAVPQVVAAGDFDGDGAPDVVALTGNFATLFHGAGRTFSQSGGPIAIGGGATFAAVANVNGDAAQDLVVASPSTSTAAIVLGGAGGLGGARALPAGTGTSSTVSADFNGDGLADLAVMDPPASKVYVFLQTSTGALTQSATISTLNGAGPTYGAAADFNGDGKLDLAIVNVNFSSVGIALGNGTGGFAAPTNTGVGQGPGRIAIADFNGDGKPDLAVPATIANKVSILIQVTGGFGSSDITLGNSPAAVAVADFNGDNKKDLAIVTTGEASIKVGLGNGVGGFSALTSFAIASGSQSIAAGDLDGDGKIDIVATNTTASSVSVLRGIGNGSFAAATSVATGPQPSCVVAADVDGDNRLDLVVSNAGSGDVSLLHSDGLGGFVAFRAAVGAAPAWVTVADLDHDGHPDITVASNNPFTTTLFSAR